MSKTPLAALVRRLARQARANADFPAPRRVTRREFIQRAGALAALAAAGPAGLSFANAPMTAPAGAKRIAIVGAGLAGLRAAWALKKSGVAATVYEASSRVGGRTFSVPGALSPDLTTEFGGEFINTAHEDMLALVEEFGFDLLDTQAPGEEALAESVFFQGKHWSEEELIEMLREPFARMAEDYESLGDVVDWKNEGGGRELDAIALADYIDSRGATGVGRELLRAAFVAEFGLEPEEQSCLNMLFMLGLDLSEEFAILGESDERYKVRGGNDLIAKAIASQLDKDAVKRNRKLKRVETDALGVHVLTFDGVDGAEEQAEADIVLFAIPFTTLRNVDLAIELPDWKRRAIQELGYGANAKVMAALSSPVWREQGRDGNIYADGGFPLAWDNSRMQGSPAGGVTFYMGGVGAVACGDGTPEEAVDRLMPSLDQAFPGAAAAYAGKAARMHWPSNPLTLCAYSCYKPGQWTSMAGSEFEPTGDFYFAGEHCSYDHQGYMNGAAETGRRAAELILERLGVAKAGE